MPMSIHYLGAATYGLWLASGGILGMLGIINFGISGMLVQRIASAYGKNDLRKAVAYFINGLVVYFVICILLGAVGFTLSLWLPQLLDVDGDQASLLKKCFQLAVVAMTLAVFNECLRSFSEALLRPAIPQAGLAIGRISGIGVTVSLLLEGYGLWAIPMGTLISECIILMLNILNSMTLCQGLRERPRIDGTLIRDYLRSGSVLLLATTGNKFSKESEPLIVTLMLGPETNTAYMVSRRAADIVLRLLSVIVGSSRGAFSHLAGGVDFVRAGQAAQLLLMISFSLGAICFSTYVGANQTFVGLWIGEEFALPQEVILFIGLGLFASTLMSMVQQLLYGLSDFLWTSSVIFLEGVFRIALAVWLLQIIGAAGVPIALTVSCLLAFLVLGIRLSAHLQLPLSTQAIIKNIFLTTVVFSGGFYVSHMLVGIKSWGDFALSLTLIIGTTSGIFVLLNLTKCREAYEAYLK